MYNVDNPNENKLDVDLSEYSHEAKKHDYVTDLDAIESGDADQFLDVGVDTNEKGRAGTFIQKDLSVIHCKTREEGIDISSISQALEKYGWLKDYLWKNISPAKDKYTTQAHEAPHEGYFIRARESFKAKDPVQSCLYISQNGFSQNVHNVVIAEENSDFHVITGCATAPHLTSGLHVGVSEFYVKKGATLMFTMIHDWGEKINVRPRSFIHVEEGGTVISNYISLKPVGSLHMYPTTVLDGPGAVARFNSILAAGEGCYLDVGSRIILNAPGTRAEIISRGITSGGTIIARGDLVGKVAGIKAHLECKGLILKEGLMHAIPELSGTVPGVEMSHEAAVGKIDQREIEYLMSRGLDEDEAISTIVRGFLNVDIRGLPDSLRAKLDKAIHDTQQDMM